MSKISVFPFIIAAAIIIIFRLTPGSSLLIGIALRLFFENPYAIHTKKISSKILSWSIVGLGSAMNLSFVIESGLKGLAFTALQLVFVLALGTLLAKMLKLKGDGWLLVTTGTAICGGSAIASVSSALKSDQEIISVSLAVVFLLNAVALIIFGPIGHYFELTQYQFGVWSALAIHDTSSVVGATMQYGPEALITGTTFKLARALWIVPLTLAISIWVRLKRKTQNVKMTYPWFILGFLIVASIFSFFPQLNFLKENILKVATTGFAVSLFLIGTTLSLNSIKRIGFRPFIHGVLLWITVSSLSLFAIKNLLF